MRVRKLFMMLSVVSILTLTACGNNANLVNQPSKNQENANQRTDHAEMNHSASSEVPEGLKAATNPTYKVGSRAIIKDAHMEGMKGATATIVGAYDTTVYTISYTPTTGGPRVINHKWIIHEEIANHGTEPFKPGTEVTIEADHMKGMKGATATIDTAEQTTVYMVDFVPTTGGEEVKNHKWVTESELSPKKT